jgi:hypothetical protein
VLHIRKKWTKKDQAEYEAWLKKHETRPKTKGEVLASAKSYWEKDSAARTEMVNRRNAHIPSKPLSAPKPEEYSRTSVMDPRRLAQEPIEVQDAIREKSQRIAPLYNKGNYAYVSPDMDIKTLGKASKK